MFEAYELPLCTLGKSVPMSFSIPGPGPENQNHFAMLKSFTSLLDKGRGNVESVVCAADKLSKCHI